MERRSVISAGMRTFSTLLLSIEQGTKSKSGEDADEDLIIVRRRRRNLIHRSGEMRYWVIRPYLRVIAVSPSDNGDHRHSEHEHLCERVLL
jgi:hypothetical protein